MSTATFGICAGWRYRRINKPEEELVKLDSKLQNMNTAYNFVSSNLRLEHLQYVCRKLESIERGLQVAVPMAQMRVQLTVILKALPNTNVSEETKLLIENARQAFGTQFLGPQLDRLVSGRPSNEGIHYFIMG